MTLDSALARFNRRAERLFRGAGRVERPSSTGTLDPVTGDWTPDPPTVLYEGPWNLRIQKWQGTDVIVGGVEVRTHEVTVGLPKDTPVEHNDMLVVTASRHDPSLVDRSFRVIDVLRDDWQIGRRLLVQEVTE